MRPTVKSGAVMGSWFASSASHINASVPGMPTSFPKILSIDRSRTFRSNFAECVGRLLAQLPPALRDDDERAESCRWDPRDACELDCDWDIVSDRFDAVHHARDRMTPSPHG